MTPYPRGPLYVAWAIDREIGGVFYVTVVAFLCHTVHLKKNFNFAEVEPKSRPVVKGSTQLGQTESLD